MRQHLRYLDFMQLSVCKTTFLAFVVLALPVSVYAQSGSDTPQVPVNVSPQVGASLNRSSTVTFVWQAQSGVDAYDFHLFDRTDGSLTFTRDIFPSSVCNATLCSFSQAIVLPAIPHHAWRVRAKSGTNVGGWSRSLFNVVQSGGVVSSTPLANPVSQGTSSTVVPLVPVNLSPVVNASLVAGSTVTFTWQAQPGVSAYDFHLFDRTDGALTFSRDIFPANACTQTRCSIQQTIALPAIANHAWRVRAKTVANISSWSRSIFQVVPSGSSNQTTNSPPTASTPVLAPAVGQPGTVTVPVNVTPVVGETIAFGSTATFTWQAQAGVNTYDFHLFDRTNGDLTSNNGINPADVCSGSLCSLRQTVRLPVHEDHAWRVRARSASLVTGWSRSIFDVVGGADAGTSTPVVSPTPVVVSTPTPTPTSSNGFQPGTTFYWQLQGGINTSRNADVFGIDLEDNETNGVIDNLKARGKKVVCYFSAGSYEQWRSDARVFQEADLGNPLADWPGERYADIRSANVRQIMRSRMDRAAQANCDAVEPDNTDAYQANNGLGISLQNQLDYLRFLANYAHSIGLEIALKNTVDLINTGNFASLFDFTINESCYNFNECSTLSAFTRSNKAIYIVQYGTQSQSTRCANASANNYFLAFYNANQLLDGSVYVTCN